MKVPPDSPKNVTSMSTLLPATYKPMMIPTGVVSEKSPRNKQISFSVNPVLAKVPPSDTAAAVLWIRIPIASYPANSIEVRRPKAIPSNKAWTPIASTSMIADVLLTVSQVSDCWFSSRADALI